mmetsp:Transcript_74175/g.141259  ORF Transcript_74175/g.141259 Transcript_74175/m.141259 type:complete len:134 (+) Transcript_74175:102-503(+)
MHSGVVSSSTLLGSDSRVHHEADVVTFQKDAANGTACPLLHLDLLSIVHNEIHVLVETQDPALDPQICLFMEPNLDPVTVLQVSEDLVDGESHDFLQLLVANRHGCCFKICPQGSLPLPLSVLRGRDSQTLPP